MLELVIVIAVIGFLAAIALLKLADVRRRAQETTAMQMSAYWTSELRTCCPVNMDVMQLPAGEDHALAFGQYVNWARMGTPTTINPFHSMPLNPVTNTSMMWPMAGGAVNPRPDCVNDLQTPPPQTINGVSYPIGYVFNRYDGRVWPTTDSCAKWDPTAELSMQ